MKLLNIFILVCLLGIGCAVRRVAANKPSNTSWQNCTEVIAAKPDNAQHFVCTTLTGEQYTVVIQKVTR